MGDRGFPMLSHSSHQALTPVEEDAGAKEAGYDGPPPPAFDLALNGEIVAASDANMH